MNTQKLLAVVIALQVTLVLGQWFGGPIRPAMAQIPDAGAQRERLIDQAKATNDKLDKVIEILESGKLQVQAAKPDDSEKKQ